jgi:hypothetical protein
MRFLGMAALIGVCLAAAGGECGAQGMEVLGVRAQGMGGAFVAVADDATATYWNPAGLARGAIVSAVAEHNFHESELPDDGSATFVGLSLPPIGASYYRVRSAQLPPGAADSFVTQNLGLTLVQSIGEHVDVAGTVRYVHGSAALGSGDVSTNTVDFDLGAIAHAGPLSVGLVARNLRRPSFDAPSHADALTLDRHVRAGVAWQFSQSPTTLAVDVDLTKASDAGLGDERHVAIGAEHHLLPRLTVRGGFRVDTVNDANPAGSAGASVAVTPSIWIDAQITRGSRVADRSWGVSARFGF